MALDPDLRPPRSDESVGDLVRSATEDVSTLIRSELELARVELRQDVREAVRGAGLLSGAGITAAAAGLMALFTAGFGVGRALGEGWTWAGFLIVTLVLLVVAGVLGLLGRNHVEEATPPAPRARHEAERTVAALRGEDA